jgi:hypothetical protein
MFKFHSVLRIDIHTHSELYGGFVPKVRESQFSMLILSQGGSIFGDHFQHTFSAKRVSVAWSSRSSVSFVCGLTATNVVTVISPPLFSAAWYRVSSCQRRHE